MVRPKKHLGQHFLTDPSIAGRIVGLLDEDSSDIFEIGPGKGILSDHILKMSYARYRAVELDRQSIDYLQDKYAGKKIELIEGDFLELNNSVFEPGPISLIGNFPYNISSQIFFRVLENRDSIHHVVGMIQKEVAERISAPPGSRTYGKLSVLLQAYYEVKLRFNVKPGSFFPPPKVTSSVITLERNNTTTLNCDEKLFFRVVKTAFNQRRKTIRNSLKTILLNLGVESSLLNERPEQLGVNEFVELTKLIEAQM